jgi:glycosyltransferase involved in cell wall biosynthesis
MRILLVENSAKDFYISRLSFALYLREVGFDVVALLPFDEEYLDLIKGSNIEIISYPFDRSNKGAFQLLKLIIFFRRVFKRGDFAYVHSYRFQPNLLNVIASVGFTHKSLIHITGLGIVFTKFNLLYFFLRLLSQFIYLFKAVLSYRIIVQNPDDINDIFALKLLRRKVMIVEGSGVDCSKFDSNRFSKADLRLEFKFDNNDLLFICVTRLIWEKGIRELVEAFNHLKIGYPNLKLFIIGTIDKDNPSQVDIDYIDRVNDIGVTRFYGHSEQIESLLAASDYFIYPSYYREGVPRSILEALSMGLPILTTNTPGCRLTVLPEKNGLIIEPRSVDSIIQGVERILKLNTTSMKVASRKIALDRFDRNLIYFQLKQLYK